MTELEALLRDRADAIGDELRAVYNARVPKVSEIFFNPDEKVDVAVDDRDVCAQVMRMRTELGATNYAKSGSGPRSACARWSRGQRCVAGTRS